MCYCINPNCPNRQNPDNLQKCQAKTCGSPLLINSRYRLVQPLRELHQSTCIEVFEVDDRGVPKVLKVLKTNQNKYAELFEQEAKILTDLNHSGIPQVELDGSFRIQLSNGRELHCLVMEKIPGENLEQWLQKNQQLYQNYLALQWLRQLAEILDYVHSQGFFHRDIKPSNIMLKPDGQLVLVDFGTARQITQTVIDGREVTAVYSYGYTAPEQAKGNANQQSDFFALGRTFVHLLTGKHPEDLPKNSETGQLEWRDLVEKVSPALVDLIDELIAPSVQNRPKDTQTILQRINKLSNCPSLPPSPQTKLISPPPLLPWVITGLSLYIWGGVLLWWSMKQTFPVATTLQPCDAATTTPRLRHEDDINAITFSPDGKQVATASLDNTARVWDTTNGKQVACFQHKDNVVVVTFSPDGKYLATASLDKTVQVREMSSGNILSLQHEDGVENITFSPDGKHLATASADGHARVWKTTNGRRVALLPHKALVRTVVFSRNGRYLATASLDNTAQVWEWEAQTEQLVARLQHESRVVTVAFSQNGKYLSTGSANGAVKVWDWETNDTVVNLPHDGSVGAVAFSPDGKYLATASTNGTAQVWEWKVTSGVKVISVPQDNIVAVAFSPDGKYLATASANGTAQVWDTVNVGEVAQKQYESVMVAVAFSQEGHSLALASQDDTIQLWRWK